MAGEKRTQDQEETLLSQSTILVDIEGTTTSISFVKETLFPYVRENLKKHVDSKWEDEEFKKDLEKLKEQAKKDEEEKVDGFVTIAGATADEEKESLIKNVLWQMDGDRKTGALKQLQGHMWKEAYTSGTVKGHVYEDVPTALESWTNGGRKVYVYSSGSVEAQKLLFGHSISGDLLKHFSGYYDTEVGGKQESSSYKSIVGKIGVEPSTVIFLTDVIKEAKAAKEAGLKAVVVLREGNEPLTDEEKSEFTTIKSFLDLAFQTSSKRQKLEPSKPEENGNKAAAEASEPMDTAEDVEMTDVSEKKAEKNEAKEAVENNAKDKAEAESKPASAEEPMVTDAKEKPTEKEEASKKEAQTNNSEVSKPVDTPKTVQAATTEDKKSTSSTEKDSAVSEKPIDKPMEVEKVADSAPAKGKDLSDGDKNESKSKPEETAESKPKEVAKTEKAEVAKVNDEAKSQEKSADKKEEKSDSAKPEVTEATTEKPAEKTSTTEGEKSVTKATPEATKAEESSKVDATKNGDVPVKDVEKVAAPTIPESEVKEPAAAAAAVAAAAAATETKAETVAEKPDAKTPKAKESETPAAENPESSTDAAKQESKEEPVKKETVDEVKDKSTVDPEKKKLNGTTQNGDKEVSVSDDKLHSNGLKEGSSDEKLSSLSENTTAQNGEPESSSEASAESIKVKKVVDSTVTDGAAEPDVVPPVAVAATS